MLWMKIEKRRRIFMFRMALPMGEIVSYTPYILAGAAVIVIAAVVVVSLVKKK